MKVLGIIAGGVLLFGLAACQEQVVENKPNEPNTLAIPPEFTSCSNVARELAIADNNAKALGIYDSKGAYWANRAERLVTRSYECRKEKR